MSFKNSLRYYGERLKDQNLLQRAVEVRLPKDNFLCIPCGGDRVTGFTHFIKTCTGANIVYRTLKDSGENFPNLCVEPVTNAFDEAMFIVRWGQPEPRFVGGWDFEVAIAKQLGYSDECMAAHFIRCQKFYLYP